MATRSTEMSRRGGSFHHIGPRELTPAYLYERTR
jgi:hypothetical protein